MKCRLIRQENYKESLWDGGTARELAVFPETASYSKRDFLWRLSSAVIEKDEAIFSELPDYDRVLMVLDGEVVLSYENQRVTRLAELEQDRFDGGWKTRSFGRITDYNLMVRKGSEGYLDLIFPEKEAQTYGSTEESEKPYSVHTLYCRDGYAVVCAGDESYMLRTGEQMIIESEACEEIEYGIMGEGTLIRGQIFYGVGSAGESENIEDGSGSGESQNSEKASFDDFKLCIYLANVQFRWAKHVVKSLKYIWLDSELSDAVRKVESFYVTTLVFVAGLTAIVVMAATGIMSYTAGVIAAAVWLISDCLLVSPAIYMIFAPKPVRKHIKRIDQLSPQEEKIRQQEMSSNPRAEAIIKRYGGWGRR